jgi:hypothetical protein
MTLRKFIGIVTGSRRRRYNRLRAEQIRRCWVRYCFAEIRDSKEFVRRMHEAWDGCVLYDYYPPSE